MAQKYVISCCTYPDFTAEKMKELDIKYICTPYILNGEIFYDDLGVKTNYDEFYKAMKEGATTSTFQLNQNDFADYFRELLKDGSDLIHLTLSSGLSGVSNSARLALETMREEFPNQKIYLIDSLAVSVGYGLLLHHMSDLRKEGISIDDLYAWVEENKLNVHHWFFTTDLTHLVKGGRISKASGFIGGVLNICPLLNVNFEGKLTPRNKIRGKKKVISEIVEMMKLHARDGINYNGKCFVSHSACYEDAKTLAGIVEETFPNIDGKVQISSISTTIGCHTGPGTVSLIFWGDKRVD